MYISKWQIKNKKLLYQGALVNTLKQRCTSSEKLKKTFVPSVWETIFFKHWNKYLPKWNRARHVRQVTFFFNSPTNTKYRILRTIGQYFFPSTLASTYRPHRPIQGWSLKKSGIPQKNLDKNDDFVYSIPAAVFFSE